MTRRNLDKLTQVADMLCDRDLARLAKLARDTRATADRIDRLSTRVEIGEDPALNAARLAHARWAEQNRIRLNTVLARQKALEINQKAQAARSFGRAVALARLRREQP